MEYLSEEDRERIGEECVCTCGEVGIYDIEPYVEEINREQVLVCMCDKCFHMSAMDI